MLLEIWWCGSESNDVDIIECEAGQNHRHSIPLHLKRGPTTRSPEFSKQWRDTLLRASMSYAKHETRVSSSCPLACRIPVSPMETSTRATVDCDWQIWSHKRSGPVTDSPRENHALAPPSLEISSSDWSANTLVARRDSHLTPIWNDPRVDPTDNLSSCLICRTKHS